MQFLHVWLLPIVDGFSAHLLDYITDEEKNTLTLCRVRAEKKNG